jgi:RNA polymerase sigma factor (sigma-70 family)
MMQTYIEMNGQSANDTELVNACIGGDRDAFAQIVTRYQALIASIAYSATGSIGQSEDLAQETFVVAWRQLKSLQDASKLRAWLCGIARRLTANALRRELREPSQQAQSLEEVMETPAAEAMPVEQAISHEEEAILWRSLHQIPENYREPLILFYREDQSVERVAESLELTQEAVRQRLSRGRKLLEAQVTSFVEGALRQSVPGRAFTANVMMALPAQMAATGFASAGATAAKGGAVKAAAAWTFLGSLVNLLPGAISCYMGYKWDMASAASAEARRAVKHFYAAIIATVAAPLLLLYLAVYLRDQVRTHPVLFSGFVILIGISWIPGAAVLLVLDKRKKAAAAADGRASNSLPALEYRTAASFLGLPLMHIRFGGSAAVRKQPVKAWLALGDVALGGLFAFGGIAVAPISFGGFALGGAVFGGFSIGALVYSGFGLGIWAIGGFVVGLLTVGGCAIGWTAALGGISIAREFAQGGVAVALHANDAAASAFTQGNLFLRWAGWLVTAGLRPTMIVATLAAIVPGFLFTRARRKQIQNLS